MSTTHPTRPASVPPAAPRRITVSSAVQVWHGDGAASVVSGKAALLLAMAALEGSLERRRAALLLWPDSPEAQARNNLRTLLHRLHQRFGAELLIGAEHLSIDASQAAVALQDTDALLAALDAGGAERCELLAQAGLDAKPGEALAAWLEGARQRLRRIQLSGLCEALAQALALAEAPRAVALARACVQLEPLSEHWHRQLMDTLARFGDRAAALAAYEDCKAWLRRQLGVIPDTQTRTVQLRLLQEQAHQKPAPPVAASARPVTAGLTPLGGAARYALVERETVLAQVQAALAQGKHVALQGEPGVGKTRLLRHLAAGEGEGGEVEPVAIRTGARSEPYVALAQLLQEVQPRRTPAVGLPEQIELARLAPLAFPGVRAPEASLSVPRLHAALRHWAARLRQAGVRRLVLDDVHVADAASQAAFAALLEPAEPGLAPLPLLLLAHRDGEIDVALSQALVAAQVAHRACIIALQRLSLHGVQRLLRAMQAQHMEAKAERLHRRTGGNPLFVIELTQQALEHADATTPVEASLDALLRSRLAACSAAAQQLASVAAVAAEDFSVELVAAVTGQGALALMPAWGELQQRGLFADHGLAHDLVREAALGATPGAIRRLLHKQVASYLEKLGLQGAVVLRHWLPAEEYDQALPHMVRQLYDSSDAGLSTDQIEVDLFGLLERTSNRVLLDNLWLTSELGSGPRPSRTPPEVWPRMADLVTRVGRLAQKPTETAWMAYERARVLLWHDRKVREAYMLLLQAASGLAEHGLERARFEAMLSIIALSLDGGASQHISRAMAAADTLPDRQAHRRLLGEIQHLHAWVSPAGAMRRAVAQLRAARRRGEWGLVSESRHRIAEVLRFGGRYRAALRHFERDAQAYPQLSGVADPQLSPMSVGLVALGAGCYGLTLTCFANDGLRAWPYRLAALATVRQRLGQWAEVRQLAAGFTPLTGRADFAYLDAVTRIWSDLDRHDGKDGAAPYRRAQDAMHELGMGGLNLRLTGWELARLTEPAADRIGEGLRLIEALVAEPVLAIRLPMLMLQVAEACAETGHADGRALVLRAARDLRRCHLATQLYLPEGLVRCAALLQATDPAEAASLLHVARRWVVQALPNVPADARDSFVNQVPVNRMLLGSDAAAAGARP